MKIFHLIFKTLMKTINAISSVLLVILTALVFVEVVMRYLFDSPTTISSSLTAILFPWLVFLAVIAVTNNNDHIQVNYFRNKFPWKIQKIVNIFSKFIMLIFSLYMIMSGVTLVNNIAGQALPILNISRGWAYASIATAFVGISIVLISQIVKEFLNQEEYEKGENNDMDYDH